MGRATVMNAQPVHQEVQLTDVEEKRRVRCLEGIHGALIWATALMARRKRGFFAMSAPFI